MKEYQVHIDLERAFEALEATMNQASKRIQERVYEAEYSLKRLKARKAREAQELPQTQARVSI